MIPNAFLPLTQTFEPTDESAAAAIVREAGESNTPVYPIGGATRLDYGAAPERPGVGLSLAQLNRVIDYPAADLTITAEAGVTLAELARILAERGQRLPIDVPQADRATVGGAAAVNAMGPRCCGYGAIRDYLLGLRAVDGRGVAFAAGGRVVKNAAGYNLCRLLAGSLGTLGVVTQVTLLVRPMPETSALAACDLRDLASAERLLAALNDSQTLPAAVELMTGPPRQDGPSPAPGGGEIRLVVAFEGSRAERRLDDRKALRAMASGRRFLAFDCRRRRRGLVVAVVDRFSRRSANQFLAQSHGRVDRPGAVAPAGVPRAGPCGKRRDPRAASSRSGRRGGAVARRAASGRRRTRRHDRCPFRPGRRTPRPRRRLGRTRRRHRRHAGVERAF